MEFLKCDKFFKQWYGFGEKLKDIEFSKDSFE